MNKPVKGNEVTGAIPANLFEQHVTAVEHYTDRLFRFRITRPASFRFRSGEFVMLGLMVEGKPLLRAYSIASPAWDEELEFFSVKVPGGPLTQHLARIREGDQILLKTKPTGTLVLDALTPAKRLYMFSTGTGIAPFASLIRDPETYEKFECIVLTQTTREVADLKYGEALMANIAQDPLIGELAVEKLHLFNSVTRERFARRGRITQLIESEKLFDMLKLPALNPAEDRAMICGSMPMLNDTRHLLEARGFQEGANNHPADFVVERAFVG